MVEPQPAPKAIAPESQQQAEENKEKSADPAEKTTGESTEVPSSGKKSCCQKCTMAVIIFAVTMIIFVATMAIFVTGN